MAAERICQNCEMLFDWEGVGSGGGEYCCQACAEGRECTCPQHHHAHAGAASGHGNSEGQSK